MVEEKNWNGYIWIFMVGGYLKKETCSAYILTPFPWGGGGQVSKMQGCSRGWSECKIVPMSVWSPC